VKKTIAIVEDEVELANNYKEAFERHGYTVSLYHNRPDAEHAFAQTIPDLVVIDIGLGDEPSGGFDLCRSLRAVSDTLPIIFLTARESDFDQVSGLMLGANEYLLKSTSLQLLLVRIDTFFRMLAALTQQHENDTVLERGPALINIDRKTVSWNGSDITATLTEFWIIECLAKHVGHLKTRDQLMNAANIVVDSATVNSHIKRIRKKFRVIDDTADPIKTEYGGGYRWLVH